MLLGVTLASYVRTLAARTDNTNVYGARLWPSVGQPGVLYNYEVMDAPPTHVKTLQMHQNNLGKTLFHLPKHVANTVVQGETTWWPIQHVIAKQKLMYLHYIVCSDDGRFIKRAYNQQRAWYLENPSQKSWYKEVVALLELYEIGDVAQYTKSQLCNKIQERVMYEYHTGLQNHRSLAFYRDKVHPSIDHGLKLISAETTWWLRARAGALRLGDRMNMDICGVCGTDAPETLEHFLWACPPLQSDITKELLQTINSSMPNEIEKLDNKSKTHWMLAGKTPQGLRHLIGDLIKKLWDERDHRSNDEGPQDE